MKLARVTSNERNERINVTLKQGTVAMLKAYQEAYKAKHGDEITQNHLIESILLDYMRDDKEFQKSLSASKGAKAAGDKAD